jgi:hypothetical protein
MILFWNNEGLSDILNRVDDTVIHRLIDEKALTHILIDDCFCFVGQIETH